MKYFCVALLMCSFYFLQAQCYIDRHNTTWYDAWVSCTPAPSPNMVRGEGHWLLYNLGDLYQLGSAQFWNANDPSSLQNGLKNIVIDYSLDGANWTEWGTHTLSQGTGKNYYEGETVPGLGEISARYILITAIDNYGGNCYSLSEVKLNIAAPCVNNLSMSGNIPEGVYTAGNYIVTDGFVSSLDTVVLDAGNCILLNAGFEVKLGAEFTTKSDGCGTDF